MKAYSSREVLKKLYADGWYKVAQEGSHIHLKHPTKKSKVTVTHPQKTILIGTLKKLSSNTGITF
jgi:predicted RNA binding protein YcfA (HicA-like mRNA interferase family)